MRTALALLVITGSCLSQQVRVNGPDPARVTLGGKATLTLVVDAESKGVVLGTIPKVEGLVIEAAAPEQRVEEVSEAGAVRLVTSTEVVLTLEPRREGTFSLPPFTVDVGGRTIRSAPTTLEAVADSKAARQAFVEVVAPTGPVWVGQPFSLTLRFGFDARFLRADVIQMFRRRLEVPVQIGAPFLDRLSGLRHLGVERSSSGQSCVVNDELGEAFPGADRLVDGRGFSVFDVTCRVMADAPGSLEIPEPWMRFAYATTFREDFIGGRVPADRHDAFVAGARRVVRVRALPEVGRPEAFTGAVGRYRVTASIEGDRLVVGEPFKLTLVVSGQGPLGHLEPPRLVDALEGFHVLGVIRASPVGAGTATFVYDLVPLRADLDAVPGVPFAFFDPSPPAAYRTIRTRRIAVAIAAGAGVDSAPAEADVGDGAPRPGVDDIHGLRDAERDRGGDIGGPLAAFLLFGPWAAWLIWVAGVRLGRGRGDARQARRLRGAAGRFQKRPSDDPADIADALAGYLAARLDCGREAVISPDLDRRLQARGVPVEVSARAADLLEGLVASRYGGAPLARVAAEAEDVVEAIEATLAEVAS